MSISPMRRPLIRAREGPYYLSPFDQHAAAVVASWPRDDHELFWLAPRTFPPLTAAKVVEWAATDRMPLLFHHQAIEEPLGYLELNMMPGEKTHLWVGHCVVCSERRGAGIGRVMVRLALDDAFLRRRASQVSLVVFPDNAIAIRCYRSCGFNDTGEQIKHFATTGSQHRMLQMGIDKQRYLWLKRQLSATGQTS